MDRVVGILVIGAVITAGLASFALAGLVGGAVVGLVDRRHGATRIVWALVALTGLVVGQVALVGMIVAWGALEPLLGRTALLPLCWVVGAIAGALVRALAAPQLAVDAP